MPVRSQTTSPLTSIPTINFGALQPEVMKPRKKSLCTAIFEGGNAKCVLLTGIVCAFLALSTWCQVLSSESGATSGNRDDAGEEKQCSSYLAVPVIFASLFYIIYLMENWKYYTKQEELITISIPSMHDWIDKMKRSLPLVWWKVTCYHYAVFPCRRGTVGSPHRVLSNVSYQRISSCSGVGRYNYLTHGFRDVSSILDGLSSEPSTRIHFTKSFVFFTHQAAKDFEEQRKRFFHEYESRDDYMEMREGMDLMDIDFPDQVIVVRDLNSLPWWRRRCVFIISVLLLQAAPLRIFLAVRTSSLHYNVLKVFGMDSRESNWDPPYADRALTDTLPPSYSEIMLQTCVQIPPAPVRPMNLPLTNMVTEERTIMNKSSTFCFGASRGSKRLRQEELATGARARGLGTPGCDPVTPSSERNTRECMAVLRSNRPRILSVTDILVRSHTAPDLTAWDAGNTQKGSYIGNEKRGTFL